MQPIQSGGYEPTKARWLKLPLAQLCCILLALSTLSACVSGTGFQPPQTLIDGQDLTALELASADLADVEPSAWVEPQIIESHNGVLNTTLVVMMGRNKVGEKNVNLRSYNGKLVGPVIEFKAGDVLNVNLVNNLPANSDPLCVNDHIKPGEDHNKPHCFNNTNLHTHGLHISPKGNSDNVGISIAPGKNHPYKFEILPAGNPEPEKPAVHYPGTHWYHAHRHGSTALQLASGMSGALILKGDIDEYPGIRGANDRLFILQQLAFDADGEVKQHRGDANIFVSIADNYAGRKPAIHGAPKYTTINGQQVPLIRLRPGQVERWRLVDSGVFEKLDIQLQGHQLQLISLDGITLKQRRTLNHLDMAPGQRADVMIKASKAGDYVLYKRPTSFSFADPPSPRTQILARVVVREQGLPCERDPNCHSSLPDIDLPAPTKMLPDIKSSELTNPGNPRKMEFSGNRGNWFINSEKFKPHRTGFKLKKGDVEEWALSNKSSNDQWHPFHIHVNPFQIVNDDGSLGDWRDTINIEKGKTIKVRTRYQRFDGKFVLHCHILFHEDGGMMDNVEIEN